MEFPQWRKRLKGILSSVERVASLSTSVILGTGLLTFTSSVAAGQAKVPADPKQALQYSKISKYSTKYLLRAARSGISTLFAQHRSHSSHSSHRSHASHSSHSSHYSSSGSTPSTLPRVTTIPPSRSPETTPPRIVRPAFGFSDSFDNGVSTRWMNGSLNADEASFDTEVRVIEQHGRLEITPRANVAGRHFNGYMTAGEWDLTDAKVSVEVVQTAGDMADTVFAIGIDSNNWYGFVMEGGTLYLQSKVTGEKLAKSIPFSATQHRFWRIRLDSTNNTISWETSRDGISWMNQRREVVQIDITSMHLTLSAGTYQVTASPGIAVFDNFRLAH
jgi:hypothetical protein